MGDRAFAGDVGLSLFALRTYLLDQVHSLGGDHGCFGYFFWVRDCQGRLLLGLDIFVF